MRFRMAQSAAQAMAPTKSGASTSAATKATAGGPGINVAQIQAPTAPSMKNSPWATFTTRITPKTSDSPSAVSIRTDACTSPSSVASRR